MCGVAAAAPLRRHLINIDNTRGAAAQALPVLQAVIPLRRANMRLRLQVLPAAEQELELLLRQQHAIIESQEAAPLQAGATIDTSSGLLVTRSAACAATRPA